MYQYYIIEIQKSHAGEYAHLIHYEYDEKNKLLKTKPEHDWSSHSSSAFIYALIAANESAEAQAVNVQFKTFVPKEFRKKKDDDWF